MSALEPTLGQVAPAPCAAPDSRAAVAMRRVARPPDFVHWYDPIHRATGFLGSLVVHMLLVISCGLWFFALERPQPQINLIASPGDENGDLVEVEGDQPVFETVAADEAFAPEPVEDDDPFREAPKSEPTAELTALAASEVSPHRVAAAVGTSGRAGSLDGRKNAATRASLVKGGGGSDSSEASVAMGLRWLARHQLEDGRWSLDAFAKADSCKGRCSGAGNYSDVGATGLALLPLLGAGNTPTEGEYYREVEAGLRWLIKQQRPNGDLRGPGIGRMYAHGQATIVLCEALALSQEGWLRKPAQKAVDFIVAAQDKRGGGWRYSPGEPGDTSVLGWQVMALRSAQMAYLNVPEDTLAAATRYLDHVQTDNYGGQYSYQPREFATESMSAEALLCRLYSGWEPAHPGVRAGVNFLFQVAPPEPRDIDIYYWYYATQVMHHFGGEPWQQWNSVVRDTLVHTQVRDGHAVGSWDPEGAFTIVGGRLYMTSLSLCILEVYYRHLPLYSEMAVER
ncbi:MAG: terpene cyclase/mutase family protein [Pirellulales bacterium]|nr:terpene cyclase/mutase family protein [Pirellulales bacterium]